MWKKESSNIYVDLLKHVKFVPKNLRLNRVKSNSLAFSARLKGNDKFHQNDYDGAMSMYNESICLAVSGSEHLSLGYANRSNCFLKMRLYNQCLVDIQLAKDTGYPESLMVKLETRKRECLKCLQNLIRTEAQPVSKEATLNVLEGSTLPWISTALQRDKKHAKGFTAKEDLLAGQTLLMEESYVHMMQSDETNYCSSCWKQKMNFIPCTNCADTMYCSQKCANNNFHESECEMTIHFEDHIDGESSIFILRSVVIGINTFTDIKEMMEFVEKCMSPEPFVCESTELLKYQTFLRLPSIISNQRISDLCRKCYIIFDSIMQSKLAGKFQTKLTQRFLMHLIAYHILILRSNSFMGSTQRDHDDTRFVQKLDLLTSYFDHSCLPNVIHLDKERVTVIKSVLPIKQGDKLIIAYINCDDYKNKGERNALLEEVYGFRCKCRLCTVGISHCVDMENDPDFSFVAGNLFKLNEKFDAALARDIKNHCVEFLSKYQNKGVCKESLFISNCLGDVLRLELSSVESL